MTHPNPLVSVIAPVYNSGSESSRLVQRLRSLEYPHVEIIIIDDASTDNTAALIQSQVEGDANFHLLRNVTNLGPGLTRQRAVEIASGDFLWFCDWDDTWDPKILNYLVAVAIKNDSDMSICRIERVSESDGSSHVVDGFRSYKTLNRDALIRALLTNEIQGFLCNKLFRRSLFARHTFENLRTHEDLLHLLKMAPEIKTVAYTPHIAYHYIERANSLTRSQDRDMTGPVRCIGEAESIAAFLPENEYLDYFSTFQNAILLANACSYISIDSKSSYGRAAELARAQTHMSQLFSTINKGTRTKFRLAILITSPTTYWHLHKTFIRLRSSFSKLINRGKNEARV